VLASPSPKQRLILDRVIAAASAVVTMTQTARSRLLDNYGVAAAKISVIPHGAADNRAAAVPARDSVRPKVLTWGLLAPRKGIEHAIAAMVLLHDRGLRVDYQVVGQTHPRELSRHGEAYRRALKAQATSGPVGDRVTFDSRFLGAAALDRLISTADVVLLLRAGLVVEQRDPAGLAKAVQRVLTEPVLSARMSRYSADLAPRMRWPAVARSYRELASALTGKRTDLPASPSKARIRR